MDKLVELESLYELAKKHLAFREARALLAEIVECETSQATEKTPVE